MDQKIKEEVFVCLVCGKPIHEGNLIGLCKSCFRKERSKDEDVKERNKNYHKQYQKQYQKTNAEKIKKYRKSESYKSKALLRQRKYNERLRIKHKENENGQGKTTERD